MLSKRTLEQWRRFALDTSEKVNRLIEDGSEPNELELRAKQLSVAVLKFTQEMLDEYLMKGK